jgi:hypothetical protein
MGGGPDREADARRRQERLAAALRENLKRRKAQRRAAEQTRAPEPPKTEGLPDGSH